MKEPFASNFPIAGMNWGPRVVSIPGECQRTGIIQTFPQRPCWSLIILQWGCCFNLTPCHDHRPGFLSEQCERMVFSRLSQSITMSNRIEQHVGNLRYIFAYPLLGLSRIYSFQGFWLWFFCCCFLLSVVRFCWWLLLYWKPDFTRSLFWFRMGTAFTLTTTKNLIFFSGQKLRNSKLLIWIPCENANAHTHQ